MNQNHKRFHLTVAIFRIAALITIVLALPLSFYGRGYPLALEKTPASGWQIFLDDGPIREGCNTGIFDGHFMFFFNSLVPHVPTPLVAGGWMSRYMDTDDSNWFHYGAENLLGYVGIGRLSEGYPSHSTWLQKTGLMITLWPFSLTAAILLTRLIYRKIKSQKNHPFNFAPPAPTTSAPTLPTPPAPNAAPRSSPH